ncbi:uncharacterized protein LACBIDRAFT_300395 [Laccaria bicolor S238N-H82]|uniref:Predicted protein n=1 Tax=Laccaria bicolor (strain S238N-H82 / ATCC MYA-4686) TaxID=486041 RepID=B0DGN4_LACBS|nr:uncharacterized protein LACBIDRAFT_300395 [Laccaria bicolor S238N-H82]EDR06300.1 predicted protein [Laccaria bicolor S238N-H82]|eukprot:XP_001883161.1 predicted protein [Laccaria bicolor S238N-H82]
MSTEAPERVVAPNPDEDVDDLDDVLSQFSSGPGTTAPPPTASHSHFTSRPRTNTRVDALPISMPGTGAPLDPTTELDEDALSSEFAKELSMGMESLMQEIVAEGKGKKEGRGGEKEETTEEERQAKMFKAAWEAMLVEGMNGPGGDELAELLAGGEKPGVKVGKSTTAEGAGGFQEKIKQAMDKLKESESNLQGDSSTADASSPESLEALLKSLGGVGGLDEGGDENELAGFLETMMGQLMSKDVLYEPLKELAEGFPPYLTNPPAQLSLEDRSRYEKQEECVKRILAVFDKPGYTDANEESNKIIVDLMSEMQSYGSPPAEIMGPLPPGLDGMQALGGEEGCVVA